MLGTGGRGGREGEREACERLISITKSLVAASPRTGDTLTFYLDSFCPSQWDGFRLNKTNIWEILLVVGSVLIKYRVLVFNPK